MDLNNIPDDEFLKFASFACEKKLTEQNTTIERRKKEVVLYLPLCELGFEQTLKKIFRFKPNLCRYEYGCIRLDFTNRWLEFLNNLNNSVEP